ncbi:MAG: 5'-3' exonuclease [Archangium sp.]
MRVHLVDGTFELFRAHYSKRPSHTSPDGKDLKASIGVVQSLLYLMADENEKATHLAVAFDNPIVSFRNRLFRGYKTDAGMDPALRNQFDDVEEAVSALGVTVWSMKEFEADDALATAALKFAADPRVEQVRIMTPDKDLGQVLLGEKIVQVDRIRSKVITEATQLADKKLKPSMVPDYLALVGDTADGIPGLDGWGEKGTAEVLGHYGSIEAIPDSVADWKVKPRGAEKLSASLARERKEAMLYKTLASLRGDVPLKETLEDLEWKGADQSVWLKWCDKVGSDSMRTRPTKWR